VNGNVNRKFGDRGGYARPCFNEGLVFGIQLEAIYLSRAQAKTDVPVARMPIPVLQTDRLILRGHGIEDFKHCAALWADPLVTRYITGTPLSREECWSRLLRNAGHWTMLGFGYWIAEEKRSGGSSVRWDLLITGGNSSPHFLKFPRRDGCWHPRSMEKGMQLRPCGRFSPGGRQICRAMRPSVLTS